MEVGNERRGRVKHGDRKRTVRGRWSGKKLGRYTVRERWERAPEVWTGETVLPKRRVDEAQGKWTVTV